MGRIRKADILASTRQQKARILKSRFRHETAWDSFQKEKVAAKKARAAAMSAVTKAPCASMLGQKIKRSRDRNPPGAPNSSLDQKKINAANAAPRKEIIVRAWISIAEGLFPMV